MFGLGETCVLHRVVNSPQRWVALAALVTSLCLTEGEEDLVAGKLKLVISDIICLNYDNKVKLKNIYLYFLLGWAYLQIVLYVFCFGLFVHFVLVYFTL